MDANAVGVIRLFVQSAHILKWNRLRGGPPDPFVSISLNDGVELGRTAHHSRKQVYLLNWPAVPWLDVSIVSFDPTWMETKFIVIGSLEDILDLRVHNHHSYRGCTLLGAAHVKLSQLKSDRVLVGLRFPILKREKQRGELLIDLIYYRVEEPRGSGDNRAGIVSLSIHGARNLDTNESTDIRPQVAISLGYDHPPICTTEPRSGLNPIWKSRYEFFCPNYLSLRIVAVIRSGGRRGPLLGHLFLGLDDLISGNETGVEWWPLSNCKKGELRMTAIWRPLDLDA